MKTNAASCQTDLHLTYSRDMPGNWRVKPTPAKYHIPMEVYNGSCCTVYIQGVCCDHSFNPLTASQVSALIDKHGLRALDYLDGSFVLAVHDVRDGIWCATDHSATLPIYYKLTPAELEITCRPERMEFKNHSEIDLEGVISSLNTGYPWGGLTLHSAWKVLKPGQVMRIDKQNNVMVNDYFLAESDPEVRGFTSPQELLQELEAALMALASRHKKLLIPLSGGVDSRLITMTCHKLGIPFEAITFVANVPDGDDFDIASRLVKIYGVKHHRWEWTPASDTLDNFARLCMSTGGTNDAYTTYPDGMKVFADISSEFDCVLRGDHSFGYGAHSESLFQSAFDLCMNFKEDLNWGLQPEFQNKLNLDTVFETHEQVSAQLSGAAVNEWRHRSRRLTRNPRAHLPIGQMQAEHATIAYPLLTRNIVKRMARTETAKRNNKLIAHEALAVGSPPDIKRIPHSNKHTWATGEPLLNLPTSVLEEMIEVVGQCGMLSNIVNEPTVIEKFRLAFETSGKHGSQGLKQHVKQALKKLFPKRMLQSYQERVSYPKTPPYMIFKRLFAVKVFIENRSGNKDSTF